MPDENIPGENNDKDFDRINFASPLIDISIRSQKAMDDHFMGFCNDFHILSNYHHDFTTEEMIGVHKFLEPLMIMDDEVQTYNKRFNVRVGSHFRVVRERLQEIQRQEMINLLENPDSIKFRLELLKKQSNDYKNKLKEKGE